MTEVVPPGYYFLSPASHAIMLFSPYDVISLEQILSIRNLAKQINIYDSTNPRNHIVRYAQAGADITLENGIIYYTEDAGMDSNDEIQIILSDNTTNTDTGITSSVIDGGDSSSTALFTIDGGTSGSQSIFIIDGGSS